MKIMPFLQAFHSVTWAEPTIEMNDVVSRVGAADVMAWDYLTPLKISVDFRVDVDGFFVETDIREVSGEDPLAGIEAVLQVDCISTSKRFIATSPLSTGGNAKGGSVSLTIPPGEVANEIDIRLLAVFARSDEPQRGLSAHRSGSRLHTPEQKWRVRLEGSGGAFPTEAFPFKEMGFPPDAAWFLNFTPQSYGDSFVAQVRLFINTDHPSAPKLLAGDRFQHSILFYDLLSNLLERSFTRPPDGEEEEWEEGSLGGVLESLTRTFLGCSLAQARADAELDPAKFKARLQSASQFLHGAAQS